MQKYDFYDEPLTIAKNY